MLLYLVHPLYQKLNVKLTYILANGLSGSINLLATIPAIFFVRIHLKNMHINLNVLID